MTASFNLLLALFLLAPGFGFFAGLQLGWLQKPFRPAPPTPGSIVAFALITFGALGTHALASMAFVAMQMVCSRAAFCLTTTFSPNPYVGLLHIRDHSDPIGDGQIAALLGGLMAVALAGLGAGALLAKLFRRFRAFSGSLYGWAAQILEEATTPAHVINAFILSDVESGGTYLGYEGVLTDLRMNGDGEITSVTIRQCERFTIEISNGKVVRSPLKRPVIPYFVIEADNIKNIALNVYLDLNRLDYDEIEDLTAYERDLILEAIEISQNGSGSA